MEHKWNVKRKTENGITIL